MMLLRIVLLTTELHQSVLRAISLSSQILKLPTFGTEYMTSRTSSLHCIVSLRLSFDVFSLHMVRVGEYIVTQERWGHDR